MDTMKLLLGATIALLLGALVVSWQGMKEGVSNTPRDEIARLEKQVNELRAEQDKLQIERMQQQRGEALASTPVASEMENMKLQLEENRRLLEEMEAQKLRDKKLAQDEEGLIAQRGLEKTDGELRRARMISEALLVGRITDYVEDEYGGFAIFDVILSEQVQIGTTLAIRRKTGILGQLKVSDITPDGGVANPLPGFGQFKPEPGDELILPPLY
jgi:outer membrane murein-binding lipoprotein Lpp